MGLDSLKYGTEVNRQRSTLPDYPHLGLPQNQVTTLPKIVNIKMEAFTQDQIAFMCNSACQLKVRNFYDQEESACQRNFSPDTEILYTYV